jgi:hypothetical protein
MSVVPAGTARSTSTAGKLVSTTATLAAHRHGPRRPPRTAPTRRVLPLPPVEQVQGQPLGVLGELKTADNRIETAHFVDDPDFLRTTFEQRRSLSFEWARSETAVWRGDGKWW